MGDDYGYFGKGATGYAHYMQSFNESGGGNKPPNKNNRNGCLSCFLFLLIPALLHIIIR